MKKLFTLFTIAAMTIGSFAQSPQKISYQAVVRNSSGVLMANQSVGMKISILQDSETGTAVYVETQTRTTNANGLVTLEIGSGTIVSGIFSGIDWSNGTYFIKTETDPTGGTNYTITGTSQILSVPYALYSKIAKTANYNDLTGKPTTLSGYGITDAVSVAGTQTISGETTFKGTTPDLEAPLFEVKNKDSQTIFAVYNEGVRIWVADGAKGTKGGFAVGGFDMIKGTNTNYLNVSTDASGIINPSQSRVLWYPLKNAFLTGKALIEHPDSVGENSFASGFESKSKGQYSQALGYQSVARGDYSTAIGYQAIAHKNNSFAFGQWATAKNEESYAFGRGAVAEGFRSYAFGSAGVNQAGQTTGVTYAKGIYSFAFGQGSQSLGDGSFTFGLADTATGSFATAIGLGNASTAYGSTALGYLTKASDAYATSMGNNTIASGFASTAIGTQTKAIGAYSTAMGVSTSASGTGSFTIGDQTTATGAYDLALGQYTTSSGVASVAMGYMTNAAGSFSLATGNRTTTTAWCTFATGYGSTASGSSSTAMGNYTLASGQMSVAMGDYTKASGFNSIATGSYTTSSGLNSFAMGNNTLANICGLVVMGRYNDTTKYNGINSYSNWYEDDPLFIIGNGSANNSRSNAVTVLKNGNTAVGHSSPTQMLDINGNARFRSVGSGTSAYNLNLTSDGTLTTTTSDISLKMNVHQIINALSLVNKLRGVTFNWKNDSTQTRQIGMIAQEVEEVVPEVVFTNPVDGLKGINYSQATALLVEAIKEQQSQIVYQNKQIDSYKSENDNLKSQLQTLQEEVEQIKAMLVKGVE